MADKKLRKKASVLQAECVACGCCLKVCPRDAIHIEKGMFAVISMTKCIGCGKCAKECPASVIGMKEVLV